MADAILNTPEQHRIDDATTLGKAYSVLLQMIDFAITYPITSLDFWRINNTIVTYQHLRKFNSCFKEVEDQINKHLGIDINDICREAPSYLSRCTIVSMQTSNQISLLHAEFQLLLERFVP